MSCFEPRTETPQSSLVTATCDYTGEWTLTSDPLALGAYQNGCLHCSGDPNAKHPIAAGGTWECENELKWNAKGTEIKEDKKVCTAKCPENSKKVIKGALECFRENVSTI